MLSFEKGNRAGNFHSRDSSSRTLVPRDERDDPSSVTCYLFFHELIITMIINRPWRWRTGSLGTTLWTRAIEVAWMKSRERERDERLSGSLFEGNRVIKVWISITIVRESLMACRLLERTVFPGCALKGSRDFIVLSRLTPGSRPFPADCSPENSDN